MAVVTSSTTSVGPEGFLPLFNFQVAKLGLSEKFCSSVGGPNPGLSASPFMSVACAWNWMKPSADFTESSAATCFSSSAGTRLRSLGPNGFCTSLAPRTSESVPSVIWSKSSSKTLPIVSVSTNVPVVNATPSATASAVVNSRSLRDHSPARINFHMAALQEGKRPAYRATHPR